MKIRFSRLSKDSYKQVADTLVEHFNKGEYKDIFELYSDAMKHAVPLDQTVQFLTGLKAQAGKMTKRTFIHYEQGAVALYKAEFEKMLSYRATLGHVARYLRGAPKLSAHG